MKWLKRIFFCTLFLPPRKTASTRLYALRNLSSSINGGGLVSTSIGGCVTGSTPQKSSVNVATENEQIKFKSLLI